MSHNAIPWWVTALIALVAVSTIVLAVNWVRSILLHWRYVKRHSELFQPTIPFECQNNGWVKVRERALSPGPFDERVEDYHLAGLPSSVVINRMLCSLSSKQLYDWVVEVHADNGKEFDRDVLRGMTIGSALFNYSIPESFVLLDRRTQLMYALFCFRDRTRKTVQQWLQAEPKIFDGSLVIIGGVECATLGITRETAHAFYLKHSGTIAPYLIGYTDGQYYPHIVGFVEFLMRKNGLDTMNDVYIHQMYITLNVMVDLMELQVPMEWVMRSPLVEAVTKIVLGEVAQKPTLTLVTKN